MLFELVWVALGLVSGQAVFGSPRPLPAASPVRRDGDEQRSVVVIIPARNEAHNLPGLLADLAEQSLAPAVAPATAGLRVIVADDSSEDDTALVAVAGGAHVVAVDPLPAGWCGKPWACQQAVDAVAPSMSGDDLLVFLDADVRLAPGAIAALVDQQDSAEVISVLPAHVAPTLREQASALFNVVGAMGIGAGRQPAGVVGPCLALPLRRYRSIGGHRSVRGDVAEDVVLGQRLIAAGATVALFTGDDLISYRMYPTGWTPLVEGWSKNVATGARLVPILSTLAIALWITALGASVVNLRSWRVDEVGLDLLAPPVAVALVALQLRWFLRRLGRFRAPAWVGYPVGWLFFVAIFVRSVALTAIRRNVRWKGRTIDLRTTPTASSR